MTRQKAGGPQSLARTDERKRGANRAVFLARQQLLGQECGLEAADFLEAFLGEGHEAGELFLGESGFLAGALRNPSAAPGQMANLFVGIAFAEALGIFSFLIALLLMFAV